MQSVLITVDQWFAQREKQLPNVMQIIFTIQKSSKEFKNSPWDCRIRGANMFASIPRVIKAK